MRTADVLFHFGNSHSAVARALKITRAAVHGWGDLVPPLRAAQLHQLTQGKLKFDPAAYDGWNKPSRDSESTVIETAPDAA